MVGPLAAFAAFATGLSGGFTLGAALTRAAARALGRAAEPPLGLAAPVLGRELERAADILLALPFAFVATGRFLFICLLDLDLLDLPDLLVLRAEGFPAMGGSLPIWWMAEIASVARHPTP
jgi:hypothetical protein